MCDLFVEIQYPITFIYLRRGEENVRLFHLSRKKTYYDGWNVEEKKERVSSNGWCTEMSSFVSNESQNGARDCVSDDLFGPEGI